MSNRPNDHHPNQDAAIMIALVIAVVVAVIMGLLLVMYAWVSAPSG